jgi:MSHA pilin protein MshC
MRSVADGSCSFSIRPAVKDSTVTYGPKAYKDPYINDKGFTLIELIMVLVLIGIIAVFVALNLGDVTATKAAAFKDKLRADIRYAQNLAMTRNQRYRVYFNTNPPAPVSGYAVVNDANGDGWGTTGANEYAQDPATGGNLSITLGGGNYAGITITAPAAGYVEFNSIGTPAVGGGLAFVAGVATITVNASPTTNVTIAAQTGAVN